jgi:hypothetical protein
MKLLPVLLRGGIAYVFTLPLDLPGAEKGDVQITSSLGLSDVLNNDFLFYLQWRHGSPYL